MALYEERDRSSEVCTRYYVELSPELRPYIEAASRSRLKESMVTKLGRAFKFSGEIRPTDIAAVIAPGPGGEKSVYPMVWGYHVPGIDHPIVNARSESVGEKKTFRGLEEAPLHHSGIVLFRMGAYPEAGWEQTDQQPVCHSACRIQRHLSGRVVPD